MKKIYIPFVLLIAIVLMSYDPYDYRYDSDYKPVLMTREQLNKAIRYDYPQKMLKPGKIYIKDNYVFIIEKHKGVHVIDNADRLNPIKKGFIHVPGCTDIAIKHTHMYIDNAVDLVNLDVSNYAEVRVVNRVNDVFSELAAPDIGLVPTEYSKYNRPESTIIVGWVKK